MTIIVCKECGLNLHPICHQGAPVMLDPDPHPDGEYALHEGHISLIVSWRSVKPGAGFVRRRDVRPGTTRYKVHGCPGLKVPAASQSMSDTRPMRAVRR